MTIGYWIFNYMPQWEAASKEVALLHQQSRDSVLYALNTRHRRLQLRGETRHIPLPWGLIGMPWMIAQARRYTINHVFASAGERVLLPRLGGGNTVLTVTKETASLAKVERNIPQLQRLGMIVVESERHADVLAQAGVPESRLRLVYPSATVRAYRESLSPFRILFASSPPVKHDMLSRGVHMMLSAAQQRPDIQFAMAWREANIDALHQKIRQAGLTNIEVHNGYIEDMDELYASCSAVILPGLTHNSLKPCPHSALEALGHGKPLLVSRPTSLSALVEREQCGVVFHPSVEGLLSAIAELVRDYERHQVNCHRLAQSHFAPELFCKHYGAIYDALT